MLERLKDKPARYIVRYALITAAGVFMGWFVLVRLLWGVIGPADEPASFWSAIEGLSSAATFAIAVGGGVMALVQLSEAVDQRLLAIESRNLDVYNQVFERLMSDQHIEARRWIYQHLDPNPAVGLRQLDDAGRRHMKLVLNAFDHLGFLLQQDWVKDDAIIRWVNPMVVKTWAKLGPYVTYEAERRGEPDYYEAARLLAKECVEWRLANIEGEIAPTWLSDAL
jgi:hypothetical protein